MTWAIDTSVIVDLLRGKDPALAARFLQGRPADYAVPEMVRAELLLGARMSSRPRENGKKLEKLLEPLKRLPFEGEAAFHWAEIRHALQQKGKPIGPNDLVIAATVRAAGFTLITRNAAEFRRVPALAMEVW